MSDDSSLVINFIAFFLLFICCLHEMIATTDIIFIAIFLGRKKKNLQSGPTILSGFEFIAHEIFNIR